MKIKYILIFIVFFSLYFLTNYYVGRKIFNGFNYIFKVTPLIFWIIFWFLSLAYIASMTLSKFLPSSITDFLYLIGSYWLSILMYSLLTFPIIGLINSILRKSNLISLNNNKIFIFETIIILIAFTTITLIGSFNARNSKVTSYNINLENKTLNNPINIVMVSDIHLGNIIKNSRLETLVNEINDLNPDIVLIAGDIVDSDINPFINNNMAKEFSKIKSKYGTFAALGNHDFLTRSEDEIVNLLNENSVTVLRDDKLLIDNTLYIIGRDDSSVSSFSNKDRASIEDITKDIDKSKPTIVIDHNPKNINESLDANIDLQVSGHTHKGQITPGDLVTNSLFEVDYGYLKKDNLNVVVSSGYGTWGPPIRIGSRSEIVKIQLN
ncbi:metallophosphoesterase [Clostridium tertium]|uniref:Putative metallophosphoesterase n=1 Tax=Clostridium tertium TaxID=1559 RepID=A0A6N3C253_9CLOT